MAAGAGHPVRQSVSWLQKPNSNPTLRPMKMPRMLAWILCSLVVSAVAAPPAPPPKTSAPAAPTAIGARHPLWKLEGKRCAVYLLGSVHILKPEHYPLPAAIEAAFDQAKVVVFETDMDALNKPEAQVKLAAQAVLPAGETLASQISPKLHQRLRAQLDETGIPAEALQNFRPGMVAMTLALVEMQKMGLDPKLGVDHHFHERARKEGKEIVGLEEPQFQMDLITGFSKEEGEAILESTLEEIHTLKAELDKLLKAWQTGDMKSVADLLNKALEKHPSLHRRLLLDRNKAWITRIEELARGDKNALVVVGAGHLAGSQSVIELLQKNGWKVVQQ
jgi:uncharacterized protein YbaP (TraB family)